MSFLQKVNFDITVEQKAKILLLLIWENLDMVLKKKAGESKFYGKRIYDKW